MAPGPRDDAQVAQLAHDVWTWARYQDPVLNWCVRRSRSFPFPLHDHATVNRQPSTVNNRDAHYSDPFPFPLSSPHPHPVALPCFAFIACQVPSETHT